jgi:hypothetical protein
MATCCGSYFDCGASHLAWDFSCGHVRGLSMACNDHPHAGARDFSIVVFCALLSVTVTDICGNACARCAGPLIATLISSCACRTDLHLCRDGLDACLYCDCVACHLQSDVFSSLGGRLRGLCCPRRRQELPSTLALLSFTGSPSALAMASSSASLTFLNSSFLFSRSSAAISSGVLCASSAFAYQFKSLPFCHRPTGAMSEWPR